LLTAWLLLLILLLQNNLLRNSENKSPLGTAQRENWNLQGESPAGFFMPKPKGVSIKGKNVFRQKEEDFPRKGRMFSGRGKDKRESGASG
jgi:hypothetical protein